MLPTLLIPLVVLLLPVLTTARQNGFELPESRVGRTFFWSADAPITTQLARYPAVVRGTDMILQHIARIENHIIASINTNKAPAPGDDIRPCNHAGKTFSGRSVNRIGFRGWPLPKKEKFTCISDVFGTELKQASLPVTKGPPFTVDELYDAVYERGRVIKANIREVTDNVINNFTDPDLKWNFPYETPSQRCVVHPAGAYRVDDEWYLEISITNHPKSANLPVFARQTLAEYPRVDDGKLGNVKKMCFPEILESGKLSENRTNTTTLIASARGIFEPSFMARFNIDNNPAILRSLDDSDLFVQQAEDALTASNIAILALPLVLNLVPIALLADVSTITMLLYTLMSDILTVVPLGIKGGELIHIGTRRHRSIFVRIAGQSDGSVPVSAAAELQAAECRANEKVLPAGIVFLVLSVVFLIGGIVAEFVARAYMMRRRHRRMEELKEASIMLSSHESSRPPTVSSQEPTPPPSLTSIDITPRETVGSPFRNTFYNDSYDTRKGNKGV